MYLTFILLVILRFGIIKCDDNPTKEKPGSKQAFCGIRNSKGIDFQITGNSHNEAEYGEFPWMVAILNKHSAPSNSLPLYICGGSLIAPNVVLTGAFWVHQRKANDILVRAGEWDTQTVSERYPFQELSVADIIVHDNFNNRNAINNVALLILDQPVISARHIGTICLPNQGTEFNSRNCFVSKWGKEFGVQGNYQVIMKKLELPTVEKDQCQEALRTTRLGQYFKLDKSFMCSGGGAEDTCFGDGGSPLVCPDPNNATRYVQAGITSWGIGCGTPGIPGVYANVAHFRNWIDSQLAGLNIDNTPYIK